MHGKKARERLTKCVNKGNKCIKVKCAVKKCSNKRQDKGKKAF